MKKTILVLAIVLTTTVNVWATITGSLVAWGSRDEYGQVSDTPIGNDFIAVSSRYNHSVALKLDGSLVAWGRDDYGQVSDTPTDSDFLAVSVGKFHNIALKSDGSLVVWGWDNYGQVSNAPTDNNFVAVSAGYHHDIALKSDGSLVVWGDDSYGQVSNAPTGDNFIAVSAGGYHTAAIKSNGSVVVWGLNDSGQVSNTPTGTNFIAVSAGNRHTVALKSDGSLVVWGSDNYGQVSNAPTDTDFKSVSTGEEHILAIKSDGSLVVWGRDDYGQVSDAPTGNNFIVASGGYYHSVVAIISIPTIKVAVDIKPVACPNPLNVKSRGILSVAILGSEDVNVIDIDPTSIEFSFGEVRVGAIRSGYEDVAAPLLDVNDCNCIEAGPDGLLDLTLKFETQGIVKAIGDVNDGDVLTLELTGVLYDPIPFERPIEGTDCILIKGKYKAYNKADINKDGVVNMIDFTLMAENWLQSSAVDD